MPEDCAPTRELICKSGERKIWTGCLPSLGRKIRKSGRVGRDGEQMNWPLWRRDSMPKAATLGFVLSHPCSLHHYDVR
jgi:hypothetical protein